MKIYIKNMVCDRCILVVRQALESLDLKYQNIELGEIEFASDLGGFDSHEAQAEALHQLSDRLASLGFVVLGDKKSQWIEGVKKACVEITWRAYLNRTKLSCLSLLRVPFLAIIPT